MRRTDTYGYDEHALAWFERFTVTPVSPAVVMERYTAGETLETLDIPAHLDRQLVVEADPGTVLYRLVQLFGTPNVPGFEAGGVSHERSVTTWQYLFDVTYEPPENDEGNASERTGSDAPISLLLSVYDYKTDVSTGLSTWIEDDAQRAALDPIESAGRASLASIPNKEFLEGVVQLVLNMTEEPVQATHKQLWV